MDPCSGRPYADGGPPDPVGDPGRLAALRGLGLLDSPPEASFDRLTRLASRILRTPVAVVSLVDDARQYFKSFVGLTEPLASARQTPLSHSFCRHVVSTGEPLVVADAREDPRVRANPAVRDMGVIAYAGVPLVLTGGHVLGALCTIDGVPRSWSEEDLADLNDLAASVMTEIELRRDVERRREVERALRRSEAEASKLALVAARTQNAVIISDAKGRIEWVNDGFTRITGYRLDEVAGRTPGSILQGPETDRATDDLMRAKVRDGEGFHVEILNYGKTGRKYWLDVEVRPIRDDEGRLTNFIAIQVDITERKREEVRLAVQHRTMQILADAATFAEASPRLLEAIGRCLDMDTGEHWCVDQDSGLLRSGGDLWASHRVPAGFVAESRRFTFAPDVGLPGRVWASGEPVWIEDIARDENNPRRAIASEHGLHGAFAFPILGEAGMIGVMSFLGRDSLASDEALVRLLGTLGRQIGMFFDRAQAEDISRVLFEKSSDAHLLLHEHDGVIDCNEAAVRMLGCRDKSELLGLHPATFSPELQPDGRRSMDERINIDAKARRDGGHRFDWWHRRVDGEVFPCEVSLTPVDVAGRSLLLVVWHDLTERKRAEEALRESEGRFRLLADGVPVILTLSSPEDGVTFINRTGVEFYGRSAGELAGRALFDFVHPDDRPACMDEYRAGFRALEPVQTEYRVRRHDGQYRWLANRAAPRSLPDGTFIGYVGSMTDVTERRDAEEIVAASERRYRFLAESIPQLVWSCDARGIPIDFNGRWRAYLGLTREQCMGHDWADSLHPDDRERTLERWSRSVETREPYEVEYRLRRASDGQYRWHLARGEAMPDDGAGAVRWFGTCTDIHDQKEASVALRAAMEAAEAATRAKSEFLANMSHEIRTPMNGIIGMTELALDTELTAEQREYLGLVKQSADGLLTVINDILDFSKIEAGKLELDPIPFGLRDCIEGAIKALAHRAHAKGLELACRVSPDLSDTLVGDPGRLRQVLFNLVGNAIKFTERGEVVIEVEREDGDVPALHFAVRDTGIGIAADKRDAIFRPFEQADGSTTRRYGGTGLGLAISARLVAMMEGRIWVESESGLGSTFHFTAQLRPADDATSLGTPLGPEALRGLSVLVADDHATNRRILEEILSSWGLRPTTVDGGRAALDELQRASGEGEPYPIVLLDARMPDLDGFALADAIRSDPGLACASVLMLSSDDRRGDAARGRALGVSTYLTKPVGQSELKVALLDALGRGAPPSAGRPDPTAADVVAESRRPLRILLAEDNPVNQKVALCLLEKRGHSVRVACDGVRALEALRRERFDVILMDVHMPEMGGFEAVARIREREREEGGHVPIVAMTANAMIGDRERCLEAGMDAYVSKPVRERDLWAAIEAAMLADRPATAGEDAAGFDAAEVLALMGGDSGLLAEVVELFRSECPARLGAIGRALSDADATTLRAAAHILKGTLAYFGPSSALDAAMTLEQMGAEGNLAGADDAMAALVADCRRLGRALERLVRDEVAV